MFDLDLSKMILVGGVALVVIGPKELPAALRVAGRAVAQLRRFQSEIRKTTDALMADASLDAEFTKLANAARVNIALNPATAMRGTLSASAPVAVEAEQREYATPEMQAYLSPETAVTPHETPDAMREAPECVSPQS